MEQTKDTTIGIGVAPCNNRATRSLVSPRVRSRAGLEKMTTVLVKICEFRWMTQISPTYNKAKIHLT